MKFRIHFTDNLGNDDHVVIEADTIEQIQKQAEAEVSKRGGTDPWSEEIN